MIRVKSTFLYDTGIVKTAIMLALGQNTQSGWRISASHHLDIRRMDNIYNRNKMPVCFIPGSEGNFGWHLSPSVWLHDKAGRLSQDCMLRQESHQLTQSQLIINIRAGVAVRYGKEKHSEMSSATHPDVHRIFGCPTYVPQKSGRTTPDVHSDISNCFSFPQDQSRRKL